MRNRLIELLKQIDFDYGEECVCASEDGYKGAPDLAEFFADHLLAEGVIVPPCKVGTTLYFLYNSPYADKPDLTPRIYKTTDWYFDIDKDGIAIVTRDIHSYNKKYYYNLGKTVFLTREEAEKALEGSENDNH